MDLSIDKASHYLMARIFKETRDADSIIMLLMYGHHNEDEITYRYIRRW